MMMEIQRKGKACKNCGFKGINEQFKIYSARFCIDGNWKYKREILCLNCHAARTSLMLFCNECESETSTLFGDEKVCQKCLEKHNFYYQ